VRRTYMKGLLILLTILLFSSCEGNEEFAFRLVGKWKWTYMCGGITGACGYADENTTRNLEITKDRMIETFDSNYITTKSYSVASITNFKDYTEYEIKFDDITGCRIRATRNTLDIEGGDTWNGYEK